MIYATFTNPNSGYSCQQEHCKVLGLEIGKAYEISKIEVGRSSSTVYLKDFPGEYFNSVHFEYYEVIDGMEYDVDVYSRFYNPYGY